MRDFHIAANPLLRHCTGAPIFKRALKSSRNFMSRVVAQNVKKMGERPHRRPQMSEGGGEDQTSHPTNMDSFIARTTRQPENHKTPGKPMDFAVHRRNETSTDVRVYASIGHHPPRLALQRALRMPGEPKN